MTATLVRHGFVNPRQPGHEPHDRGEAVLLLLRRLDVSWFRSRWRARIPDGDRMGAKEQREARGVRLIVHWWTKRLSATRASTPEAPDAEQEAMVRTLTQTGMNS